MRWECPHIGARIAHSPILPILCVLGTGGDNACKRLQENNRLVTIVFCEWLFLRWLWLSRLLKLYSDVAVVVVVVVVVVAAAVAFVNICQRIS